MNPRITRRTALLCGLACATPAWAFDRVAAGRRYRDWLRRLHAELAQLDRELPRAQAVAPADVDRFCVSSIVPASRASGTIAQLLSEARRHGATSRSGEIVFLGSLRVVLGLLGASMPAGQGGRFPEEAGSAFAGTALNAWYMHVHAGEALERYFGEGGRFKPYRLPQDGELVRDAYPFLLFDDREAALRFGGFSSEWWGAVETLYHRQFM